jgi:hypothetical protein
MSKNNVAWKSRKYDDQFFVESQSRTLPLSGALMQYTSCKSWYFWISVNTYRNNCLRKVNGKTRLVSFLKMNSWLTSGKI